MNVKPPGAYTYFQATIRKKFTSLINYEKVPGIFAAKENILYSIFINILIPVMKGKYLPGPFLIQ